MLKRIFPKLWKIYRNSIIKDVLLKSFCIAFTSLFLYELVLWIWKYNLYLTGFILFIVILIISFLVLYFRSRPTEEKFAKKLDSLGLEQRVITAEEFKESTSLMARIQREDAINKINKLDKNKLVHEIKTSLIILCSLGLILSIGSITVNAFTDSGSIPNGGDIIDDIIPGIKTTYEVSYDVDGEGYIDGEMFQVVEEGEDATAVMAVAEDGWAFIKWSDGLEDPYRCDLAIGENLTLTAEFGELDEQSQDGEPGDGESEDGDQEATEEDGKPSDSSSDKQSSQSDQNGDDPGQGMGGSYEPNNQVIDGETYYGDSTYDEYYNETMNSLQQDGQISDDVKSIIGDYYDNIEQ